MELPFLKNKIKKGGLIMAKTVEGDDSHLKRTIAREMWDAIEKKDEESSLHAFEALVMMIQEQDEIQDAEEE